MYVYVYIYIYICNREKGIIDARRKLENHNTILQIRTNEEKLLKGGFSIISTRIRHTR